MSKPILDYLAQIKNPNTNKSLLEEGRFVDCTETDGLLNIKYNREGINPIQKKEIEKQIISAYEKLYSPEKIMVTTISERSEDVYNSLQAKINPEKKDQAQLKVGHGTVGTKKPVPGVKHIIAVGSGKGGVGKSTFTVNLAQTMQKMGKKVGIIDADIYGPSIPMLLNKRHEKPMANDQKKIIPIESSGIKFMSFGLFVNENEPVIWRGPMLGGVLNQFLFDVEWNGLDYLIIDLPPGTGDIQLSMVQNVEVKGAIIISTPQDVALLDAVKGLEMFRKLNIPIIGMIENMSSFICDDCGKEHFIFGSKGVENNCDKITIPYLGSIPLELALRECSDLGTPYMSKSEFEGRPVWNSYIKATKTVLEFFGEKVESKSGFWGKIFK